jgi:rRNA maturation endonuclease Nob1
MSGPLTKLCNKFSNRDATEADGNAEDERHETVLIECTACGSVFIQHSGDQCSECGSESLVEQ